MKPTPNPKHYMKERPKKKVFSKAKQKIVLREIKKYINKNLPPKTKLYRKRLFRSLAKGKYGKYINGTWKGRKYSDVDVLFVVDDNFKAPKKWKFHFQPEDDPSIVYNVADVPIKVEDEEVIVELQYFIVPISYARIKKNCENADPWGVPLMRTGSKNTYIGI
tara:strand:+ start:1162 stop:1650 length:489 start_codon:yes stop_codon:yes gene_type:complete